MNEEYLDRIDKSGPFIYNNNRVLTKKAARRGTPPRVYFFVRPFSVMENSVMQTQSFMTEKGDVGW